MNFDPNNKSTIHLRSYAIDFFLDLDKMKFEHVEELLGFVQSYCLEKKSQRENPEEIEDFTPSPLPHPPTPPKQKKGKGGKTSPYFNKTKSVTSRKPFNVLDKPINQTQIIEVMREIKLDFCRNSGLEEEEVVMDTPLQSPLPSGRVCSKKSRIEKEFEELETASIDLNLE